MKTQETNILPKNQQYILDKLKEGYNLHYSGSLKWELKWEGKSKHMFLDGRSAKAIISKGLAVQVLNTTDKIYTFPYRKL